MSDPFAVAALRLDAVARTYREGEGQLEVFRDVNLSLAPGELVALVGPSGAGKSSLLHMAGLLEAPSGGEIVIAGVSIGVTGTFLGFVLGVLFCGNIESIRLFLSTLTGTTLFNPEIYFLSRMPAEMDPAEVIAVVAMSLTLTFLATLYPSWRAARLDPVEALRYE